MHFKRFVVSFVQIFILLVIFDFFSSTALGFLYSKQKKGEFYITSNAINTIKSDYLVFGSSRANHHYNPAIFEKTLNVSFYNCGKDAQGLYYSAALINAITARYKPKLVIIDIKPFEFSTHEDLSVLLPYKSNPAIKPFLKYNKNSWIKLVIQSYPYNSILSTMLLNLRSKKAGQELNGYIPLHKVGNCNQIEELKETEKIDTATVHIFENMLSSLNKKNIPNIVICSPIYEKIKNPPSLALAKSIAKKYRQTRFYSYLNDPQYTDCKLFKDTKHLNDIGSDIFSKDLAKKIQNNLYNTAYPSM